MRVEPLGLESGEAAGDRERLFAHRGEMIQAFLQAEVGQEGVVVLAKAVLFVD